MKLDTPVIFDLGLHMGEDTEYYLAKGFRVVAFEANPKLIEHCKATFAQAIENGRLVIIEGAVAPPENGPTVKFYIHDLSIWGTIQSEWNERNRNFGGESHAVAVQRVNFPSILFEYGAPYYMKIDLEGVDQYVIECIAQTGFAPEFLSIESNIIDLDAAMAEVDTLVRLGYQSFMLVQQKNIPGMEIDTTTVEGIHFKHTFREHSSGPFGEDLQQEWLSEQRTKDALRKVFRRLHLFGNNGVLTRLKGGRRAVRLVERSTGTVLSGWHDLHARRVKPSRL